MGHYSEDREIHDRLEKEEEGVRFPKITGTKGELPVDFDKSMFYTPFKQEFEDNKKGIEGCTFENCTISSDIDKGTRHNKGKIRYDLIEPYALKQLALVFTKGSTKYGDRNWEKGMKWSNMEASLMRHLEAYKQGEDFDIDPNCKECKEGTCTNHTGLLHMAQVAWNAMALVSYYKLYPQGDDRRHNYLNVPKIGLDIDEVICDWVGAWTKKFGYNVPECWNFMYKGKEHFDSFSKEELHEFYVNIPTKIKPSDIPFEPHCYITSRSVELATTQEWILKNGFPTAPIYSVGFGESKVEVAKKSGIDIFVDDRYENFVELNNAGICTYLLSAPHNLRYNVGYKRLNTLKELLFI